MSDYVLNIEERTELGKGASRRLRRANGIPAVIYGGDQGAVSITMKPNEITRALMDTDFYTAEITLQFEGGKSEKVNIVDLQRHPVKEYAMHADFKRV